MAKGRSVVTRRYSVGPDFWNVHVSLLSPCDQAPTSRWSNTRSCSVKSGCRDGTHPVKNRNPVARIIWLRTCCPSLKLLEAPVSRPYAAVHRGKPRQQVSSVFIACGERSLQSP